MARSSGYVAIRLTQPGRATLASARKSIVRVMSVSVGLMAQLTVVPLSVHAALRLRTIGFTVKITLSVMLPPVVMVNVYA